MVMFKDRVRELRKQRNVSQAKLAMAVDVDKSSVSKWESGDRLPSWDVAQRIANYFSVSLEYLMGITTLPDKDASPDDLAEFALQNVIYEDETDAPFIHMGIRSRPKEGVLVKEPELPAPSAEALEIAHRYDTLDMHGREIIRAVLRIEDKRCEAKRAADAYLSELPTNEYGQPVGIAYQDGTVEAKYAAKKELCEMQEEKVDV